MPNSEFILEMFDKVYRQQGYDATKGLLRFESIVSMAQAGYNVYLKNHSKSIEQLPTEQKQALWNESGAYHSARAKRIEWCRAMYFVDQLVNEINAEE
jgi:hypothetical protein